MTQAGEAALPGEEQVFCEDGAAAVSERAKRAGSVCVRRRSSGVTVSGADERRDEEEVGEEEKSPELFDDGGVAFKRDVAGVCVARQ